MGNKLLKLTSVPSVWADWRRKCPSGHWTVIVDRFAAKRGSAQVVMGIVPWSPSAGTVRNGAWARTTLRYASVCRGFLYESELPLWAQERMAVLKVVDEETWVPGVGGRFTDYKLRVYNPYTKQMDPIAPDEEQNCRYYVLDMQVL